MSVSPPPITMGYLTVSTQPSLHQALGRLAMRTRLSENRNTYLHSTYSQTTAGRAIMKGEDHRFGVLHSLDSPLVQRKPRC